MSESQIEFCAGGDDIRQRSDAARAARTHRRTSPFSLELSARQRFASSRGPRYFGTGMAGFTSVPWIGL